MFSRCPTRQYPSNSEDCHLQLFQNCYFRPLFISSYGHGTTEASFEGYVIPKDKKTRYHILGTQVSFRSLFFTFLGHDILLHSRGYALSGTRP